MIPHKINYCWFGHGPKSELIEKCIASWKKYFPNYEIIEWNESNFEINQNVYCREAYENKKWAFVSDYARLKIIFEQGGLYFDTDVEVLKPFEQLLEEHGYLAYESPSACSAFEGISEYSRIVATGLGLAAEAGDPIIEAMLRDYEDIHFINHGEMDLTPCTIRNTKSLLKVGLINDGNFQTIGNICVYPSEYFCGFDLINYHPLVTEKTCTMHHYAATWTDSLGIGYRLKAKYIIPGLQRVLGYSGYDKLVSFKHKLTKQKLEK